MIQIFIQSKWLQSVIYIFLELCCQVNVYKSLQKNQMKIKAKIIYNVFFVRFLRSRIGFRCLPTSLCQHASATSLGCVVLLHAALPRTWQRGFTMDFSCLKELISANTSLTLGLSLSLSVCDGWGDGYQSHGWILQTSDWHFQAEGTLCFSNLCHSLPSGHTLCHAGK